MNSFTILFFSLLGIILFGGLIHEGIHILQAKEPYSICWDINQKAFMHVLAIFPKNYNIEILAYSVQLLMIITLGYCIVKDFKIYNKKQ